ncbi:phage antirepressor KilAC domain-containing protein [Moraxella sp. ZY210820]|uniref:phage antirepressor KilAC domain-containing protein n=1 Tax=unclassified Moraxella TaxID=2685852 RepID=UPI0027304B78|nr:phage antirepressor KilAC domain-containing protein [Moraxella sp. ZY210820]WLF83778.1 phage regulatory protein/antirepressor Ant [Moraxella sp. ZY210820]
MNSPIIAQFTQKTMSSLEIAELCQKTHANVLRDIRTMFDNLGHSFLNDEQYQILKDERGYMAEILLNKNLTLNLVSGYNAQLRMAIIKRWQQLEQQQQFNPANLSRMDILQLAMQAEQENQHLKQRIAVIEPQAHALQRITQVGEDLGLRESAKVLKIAQDKFINFLIDKKWIYRDAKYKPQAYQDKINQGYLIHHYSSPQQTAHGERVFSQVKITAKGVAKLSMMLNQGAV